MAEHSPGPFVTMLRERGTVTIQALGGERFQVKAGDDVDEVAGFDAAQALAHQLADALGAAVNQEVLAKLRTTPLRLPSPAPGAHRPDSGIPWLE